MSQLTISFPQERQTIRRVTLSGTPKSLLTTWKLLFSSRWLPSMHIHQSHGLLLGVPRPRSHRSHTHTERVGGSRKGTRRPVLQVRTSEEACQKKCGTQWRCRIATSSASLPSRIADPSWRPLPRGDTWFRPSTLEYGQTLPGTHIGRMLGQTQISDVSSGEIAVSIIRMHPR